MKQLMRGALLAVVVILAASLGVKAAPPPVPTGAASGLSISPLRFELTLKPGQADKIDVSLKNITGGPITAQVGIRDFQSDNVSGNPKIITDPAVSSPASIRTFLVGAGNVSLGVGEQKTITIPVQVPDNAVPGAYYGLLTYQAVPAGANANTGSRVALSAAVSALVLITVPGNLTERVQVNAIRIYKDKDGNQEGGLFFSSSPKAVGIDIKNLGNGFAKPFGHVSVQKAGKEVLSYELNGGITRGLILPHSSRTFKNEIKSLKPGRYTVVANVSYGSGSAIITAKKTFWYIQPWMWAVAIAVVLALAALAWRARRRFKRVSARQQRRY